MSGDNNKPAMPVAVERAHTVEPLDAMGRPSKRAGEPCGASSGTTPTSSAPPAPPSRRGTCSNFTRRTTLSRKPRRRCLPRAPEGPIGRKRLVRELLAHYQEEST